MNEPNKEQQEELKEKHERTKRKLKIIGIIVAVAGLGFTVMGLVDMISSTSKGEMPALFWGLILTVSRRILFSLASPFGTC